MVLAGTVAIAVALALSAWLTQRFCDPQSRLHLLDHPNERSLHTRPTPRSGGVAILGGIVAGTGLWALLYGSWSLLPWLGAAGALVAGLSFLDDMRGLPAGGRLVGHGIAAAIVVGSGLYLGTLGIPGVSREWPVQFGYVVSALYLVWMINLYNFMDGMDGFAGGMAVMGFGTFAVLGVAGQHPAFAIVSLIVAAAAGGFLLFNFPPARIFMGDTGSSVLGLLAGGLSLWGARDGLFPFWVAILTFSPFIVDATVTLARRLLRGERVWQAHRTHYYQRLVQLGWGHRRTVIVEYGLMLACGASAILAVHLGTAGQWLVLLGWSFIYPVLMLLVTRLERRATTPA